MPHHSAAKENINYGSTVSEYDYLKRTFSPTRESYSRYSHATSGRTPFDSTFQASTYRPSIDRSSAHRSFDSSSGSMQTRTNIRSRHRTFNRFNAIRSKSANPPDREYQRNEHYYASNLDYCYRPEKYGKYDKYDKYDRYDRFDSYDRSDGYDRYDRYDNYFRRPLTNASMFERRVTQNSDIKLTHNVMADDASIKWYRNNSELPKSSRCRSVYRDGLAMLEIFSAQIDDTAKYTCVARNKSGINSFSSHLKVFPDSNTTLLPPIFTRAMKGEWFFGKSLLPFCSVCA